MKPEDDKTPSENSDSSPTENPAQAPADALSRTPDDLEEEKVASETSKHEDEVPEKKISPLKKFFRKVNLYFLIFLLLIVIAGIVSAVSYFNSQKAPTTPDVESQNLSEDALKQLANTDASVGGGSQTLTIQGNAIITGQTLMRGNLNVAGNFQTGGKIQGPSLTISDDTNLNDTQISKLQVKGDTAIQGSTTVSDLNVSGSASFSGAVKASQLTVTKLVLSGNATLQVPNHISFTGPTPSRTMNAGVLGRGGSTSINGSDTSGTVNIGTGSGTAPGCFVRIAFNQPFSNKPHVIISPVGSGAGKMQYYVDRDNSGFSICTASAAPTNQDFAFDYFVTN